MTEDIYTQIKDSHQTYSEYRGKELYNQAIKYLPNTNESR